MPFERARTALSNVEDRVRRVFGLVGKSELDLDQKVNLVALVADLTLPGSSVHRGRRWALVTRANTIVAGGFGWVFRLATDSLVTLINVRPASVGTASLDVWFLPPGTAPVNAANLQAGTWIDNKLGTTDLPPLFISAETPINLAGETAPTSRNLLFSTPLANNQTYCVLPLQAYFPAGTHIIYRRDAPSATDDDSIGLYGQIF